MSFGVGQSAVSSVKNNLNLFSKRTRLKNTLYNNCTNKLEFKSKRISSNELMELRRKLKKENVLILRKRVVVVAVIMSILVSLTCYFI